MLKIFLRRTWRFSEIVFVLTLFNYNTIFAKTEDHFILNREIIEKLFWNSFVIEIIGCYFFLI